VHATRKPIRFTAIFAATILALVAAIPAFIAYNRYADKVSRLELRYNAFMEEFSTILQRHASRPGQSADGA